MLWVALISICLVFLVLVLLVWVMKDRKSTRLNSSHCG